MTPENEALLVSRYPHIFRDHGGDPSQTCMAWGISVGDGWFTLIDVLCAQLSAKLHQEQMGLDRLLARVGQPLYTGSSEIIDEVMIDARRTALLRALEEIPVAAQVKEKFGGLRFYVDGGTPSASAMISLAEALSYRTCEECGATHQTDTYTLGWNRTLCPEHADAAYGADKAAKFRSRASA